MSLTSACKTDTGQVCYTLTSVKISVCFLSCSNLSNNSTSDSVKPLESGALQTAFSYGASCTQQASPEFLCDNLHMLKELLRNMTAIPVKLVWHHQGVSSITDLTPINLDYVTTTPSRGCLYTYMPISCEANLIQYWQSVIKDWESCTDIHRLMHKMSVRQNTLKDLKRNYYMICLNTMNIKTVMSLKMIPSGHYRSLCFGKTQFHNEYTLGHCTLRMKVFPWKGISRV